jgi:hypothetical protein
MLAILAGGNYKFKFNNGLLSVYGYIDGKVDWNNPLIRNAEDASEASRYIYGATDASGIDKSLEQFKAEKSAYWNENPSGNKVATPSKITQSEFDKKWAALKPGQTLVGPNGVTYKKK